MSDIREAIKAMPKGDVAVVVSASSLNGAGFRTEALQALLDRLERLEGAAGVGPDDDFDVKPVLNYDS